MQITLPDFDLNLQSFSTSRAKCTKVKYGMRHACRTLPNSMALWTAASSTELQLQC